VGRVPRTSQANQALAKLQRITTSAEHDPVAQKSFAAARQKILKRFEQDADAWYDRLVTLADAVPSRDLQPQVNLVLEVVRNYVPRQIHHDAGRHIDPKMLSNLSRPMQLTIKTEGQVTLERGTRKSRDHSIELERQERKELEAGDGTGTPVFGPRVDRSVA
jgi:hypothetical protein